MTANGHQLFVTADSVHHTITIGTIHYNMVHTGENYNLSDLLCMYLSLKLCFLLEQNALCMKSIGNLAEVYSEGVSETHLALLFKTLVAHAKIICAMNTINYSAHNYSFSLPSHCSTQLLKTWHTMCII